MMRICRLSARPISLLLQPRLHHFVNPAIAAMQRSDTASARFVEPPLLFKGTSSHIWRRAFAQVLKSANIKKEIKINNNKNENKRHLDFLSCRCFFCFCFMFYFWRLHYSLNGKFEALKLKHFVSFKFIWV